MSAPNADRALPRAVVIGGSAGSIEVLLALLAPLPPDYALPIGIVVHLPGDRPSLLARVLGERCRIAVREVDDKEPLEPGTAYVGPPGYHLMVDVGPAFALSVHEPVNYSLPSIDVFFESAARVFAKDLAGVLLSGANRDGACGLRAIQRAGGLALVQDPATALATAMPEAGLSNCPGAGILGPEALRDRLLSFHTAASRRSSP